MTRSDYFGLPNRSKHLLNIKLNFEKNSYFANIRTIYKSKWAIADKNGNGLYDNNDEFADGYVQVNFSAGKTFKNGLKFQLGSDNITNYVDASNLPNLPGRTFYISIQYNFLSKNKQSKR